MRPYPIPFNEPARLEALHSLPGADFSPEPAFRKLAEVARRIVDTPVAHISLIDETYHYSKGGAGLELIVVPREMSICAHSLMSAEPMIVPDLSRDPRFRSHPMVEGAPHLRFYLGVPLTLSSGFRVGSLCMVDYAPRSGVAPEALAQLKLLAEAAALVLERQPQAAAGAGHGDLDGGRSEFLALIGHELRTPLTVLSGSACLLEQRLKKKGNRRMASAARRSCEHLREIVETIIAFSDVGTGDLVLQDHRNSLGIVLGEVLEMHQPIVGERGKSLRLAEVTVPDLLQMDAGQIRIALGSLVENAMLHGGERIEISAGWNNAGHLAIVVADDGSIDSGRRIEELARPFVVGGALDTRPVGGLGLGLPLVRKIVELHGGEFTLTADERGTVATICLPAWRSAGGGAGAAGA